MKTDIYVKSRLIIKRMLAVMLCTATALSLCSSAAFTASAVSDDTGDVDGNGVINSADALLALRSSVGLIYLSDGEFKRADVNGDGKVDSNDALCILQSTVGLGSLATASIATPANTAGFADKVVELCNEERAKRGISPLQNDSKLANAAAIRAEEISDYFDHSRPDGRKWSTVLGEIDYNFLKSGENIAEGLKTPEAVVEAWMNSEEHKKNILSADYNRIGVAFYFDVESGYGTYWDQLFSKVAVDFTDEQKVENDLLNRINQARAAAGMNQLKMNAKLRTIAEIRADDITKKMDNVRPDGSDWKVLIDKYNVDYTTLSQMYCAGQQDDAEVFEYYTSGSNVPKFLDPSKGYRCAGIGHAFVDNDQYAHYWVFIFTD